MRPRNEGRPRRSLDCLLRDNRRSRLPEALDALLRALQGRGVVQEVTGRGRFRAFAV
jgi:hypothetical protein